MSMGELVIEVAALSESTPLILHYGWGATALGMDSPKNI
jgi:hypothetical protein